MSKITPNTEEVQKLYKEVQKIVTVSFFTFFTSELFLNISVQRSPLSLFSSTIVKSFVAANNSQVDQRHHIYRASCSIQASLYNFFYHWNFFCLISFSRLSVSSGHVKVVNLAHIHSQTFDSQKSRKLVD